MIQKQFKDLGIEWGRHWTALRIDTRCLLLTQIVSSDTSEEEVNKMKPTLEDYCISKSQGDPTINRLYHDGPP